MYDYRTHSAYVLGCCRGWKENGHGGGFRDCLVAAANSEEAPQRPTTKTGHARPSEMALID